MSSENQGSPAPAAKKLKTGGESLEELQQKARLLCPGLSEDFIAGGNEEVLSLFVKQAETVKEQAEKIERQAQTVKERAEKIERYSMSRLIKFPPKMVLTSVGTEKSHTGKAKHREATSRPHELDLESLNDDDTFSFDDPSSLLVKFLKVPSNNTDQLEGSYNSESDVSGWITAALEDAQSLAYQATGKVLHVHHEFSLWSDRPDHLVLYDAARHDPIIAVEDKKPFRHEKDEEKISNHVLGQMFDYLMEMRSLGHSAPFAVLSTFDKSWLFWRDDKASNEIVASKNRLAEVKPKLIVSPTKPDEATKKTPSPPELKNETKTGIDNTGTDSPLHSTFDECARNDMLQTKAFNSKQLVPLLYTAIICGLARNPTAPRENYSSVRESYNGIALQLTEKNYNWGHLKLRLGSSITFQGQGSSTRRTGRKPCAKGTFFAIEKLGRGDTSKVFDAYDYSGNRCAIKMYIKRGKDQNEKLQSLQESKATGKESCDREAQRLQEFYPFLEDKVSSQELNTFPCVIMPFFRPLSKKERDGFREDGSFRKQVRGCLSALAEKHLKYHESDLRWRHIGYYDKEGTKVLVMFDLADLEVMNDKEKKNPEDFVDSQIESLLERLPDSGPEGQSETNGVSQDA